MVLGRFEGAPSWVPYFYNLFLEGEGEPIGEKWRIKILQEDVQRFPELKGKRYAYLVFSDVGFVDGYVR